ncbi:BTAD domain-containing putative transcriptional regulator [Nonomuraea thailandensis]
MSACGAEPDTASTGKLWHRFSMGTRFGVLGALEVVRDGVPVTVSALKQRIALATLLLQANQHVSLDQLAERMWDGKETPDDARGAVQTHIARLRRILRDRGDDGQLIHTREEGYVLQLAEKDLDVAVFLDLVGRAKRAGQAGDEAGEADLLQRSLALWRGPALVDVPSESLYRDHVLVLNEQRVQVMERWFELGLRSGGHDELVVELKAATAAHPLRERLWAQLMLALYRSGHQAEALQVYNVVGDILRQELGIHPGDELRKLHHDILTGDHGLLVPSAPASTAPVSGQPDGVPAPPPRTAEPGPVPSAVLPVSSPLTSRTSPADSPSWRRWRNSCPAARRRGRSSSTVLRVWARPRWPSAGRTWSRIDSRTASSTSISADSDPTRRSNPPPPWRCCCERWGSRRSSSRPSWTRGRHCCVR